MGEVLRGCATTTEVVCAATQNCQKHLRALSKRYGIDQNTVAKRKKRAFVTDLPTDHKQPKFTVLSVENDAIMSRTQTDIATGVTAKGNRKGRRQQFKQGRRVEDRVSDWCKSWPLLARHRPKTAVGISRLADPPPSQIGCDRTPARIGRAAPTFVALLPICYLNRVAPFYCAT